MILKCEYVNETLVSDHSNESYVAVLSCGAILIGFQIGFSYFFKYVYINLVFGDELYPEVSTTSSIS